MTQCYIARISFLFISMTVVVMTCADLYAKDTEDKDAEECFYNPAAIDKNYFIENTKFKDGKWNDELKEATVQINKIEQVTVKYYACEHLGLTAALIFQGSKIDPSHYNWKEKIKWLGRQVLGEEDFNLMLKAIEDKEFNEKLLRIKKKDDFFTFCTIFQMGINSSIL